MARRHYWQFLVTDEGNPIENAEITIAIAGTDDPAYVYTDEIGGTATNVGPQTQTSRKGYFEFWVADSTELNGYSYSQKFKLMWSAAGVAAGFVDYVDVFSTSVAEVDVTSTDPLKNKAVSNLLAKGWEDHKDTILYAPTSFPTSVHGITLVDEAGWDAGDSENTKYNKLVNNQNAWNWESHAETIYLDGSDPLLAHLDLLPVPLAHPDGFYYKISSGAYYPVGYEVDGETVGGPGNPHNIYQISTVSTDTEKNKLISNALGKQWHDHRTNVGLDEHTQYSLVSGTRNYTAGVGYINGTIVTGVAADDFITKAYVDGGKYSEAIASGSFSANGDGTYTYSVIHNVGVSYPVITVWDTDLQEVIQPHALDYTGVNSFDITVSSVANLFVRVLV